MPTEIKQPDWRYWRLDGLHFHTIAESRVEVDPLRKFVRKALGYVGSPYIWGGNGRLVFSVERKALEASRFGPSVFDCCGLVNVCLKEVGGPDWRGQKNAQTLFDELAPAKQMLGLGTLLFYGARQSLVTHVAISIDTEGWLVEAAGGGRINLTLPSPGSVRVRDWQERGDFLGARILPLFTTTN